MVERLRPNEDAEGADAWLRIIVIAIGERQPRLTSSMPARRTAGCTANVVRLGAGPSPPRQNAGDTQDNCDRGESAELIECVVASTFLAEDP